MIAWFLGSSVGRALAGAALAVVAAAVIFWKVFSAGKSAAKAEAAVTAVRRAQDASRARAEAARKPTPEEEARDPYNRDGR